MNTSIEHASTASMTIVELTLGNDAYGVPIECVREIIRKPPITHLPNAEQEVIGIINLRGNIIPMLSLNYLLGLNGARDEGEKVLIVEDESVVLGLLVNEVREVQKLDTSCMSEPPQLAIAGTRAFISGIARVNDKLLSVLNLAQILHGSESVNVV